MVLGTLIVKMIGEEHDFHILRRVFLADSITVLRRNSREFKSFVANHSGKINVNSEISELRWVPTREKPADNGTHFASDDGRETVDDFSVLNF